MLLHDLNEFLKLSGSMNMQLAARGVRWGNIVRIITDRASDESPSEYEALIRVLEYLDRAYEGKVRKLGTPAILHPLRATALLSKASGKPQLLDMLTELLHDKYEDLTMEALGTDQYTQSELKFHTMLKSIDPTDEWYLMERLDHLKQGENETYYQYIGRLLQRSVQTPELVRVKLADRLDNTLDLHIDVDDFLKDADFFRVLFHILFPPSGAGYRLGMRHPDKSPFNGAQRLYQLFKNAILLSLIREKHAAFEDPTARRLFEAVALAGMHESQRIALHIMAYHETDIERQRSLLMEVQRYAQAGGLTQITPPGGKFALDGFCMMRFDYADSKDRSAHLEELYKDKGLMLQAAIGFEVIFMNFTYSPDYWIRGISDRGINTPGS